MPVYNEANSIGLVLRRIAEVAQSELTQELEIIVVDDASSDDSVEIVRQFAREQPRLPVRLISQPCHRGRGAAIRTALEHAEGELSLIWDANFAYDPGEYPKLIRPLLSGDADLVLGSRLYSHGKGLADRLINAFSALACRRQITDAAGYKGFRTVLAQSIPLRSNGVGLHPELVIKFAQRHAHILEIPVSNHVDGEEPRNLRAGDALAGVLPSVRQQARKPVAFYHRPTGGIYGRHPGKRC